MSKPPGTCISPRTPCLAKHVVSNGCVLFDALLRRWTKNDHNRFVRWGDSEESRADEWRAQADQGEIRREFQTPTAIVIVSCPREERYLSVEEGRCKLRWQRFTKLGVRMSNRYRFVEIMMGSRRGLLIETEGRLSNWERYWRMIVYESDKSWRRGINVPTLLSSYTQQTAGMHLGDVIYCRAEQLR